ncbi:MAG: hypothetical protein WA941_08235 [Nitrososphaeraceae archaeon]
MDTSVENVSQFSNQRNYRARDSTNHFPNKNISASKTALSDAGNSVLPAQESSQAVEDLIRNQALRDPASSTY